MVSIDLRSKFPKDEQELEESIKNELDYCKSLNRVLPQDIRCVAWMPLKNQNYSARFDCKERTYRYFFPRGHLNVDAMKEGCKYLVGVHDFRNLCKMDVANGVITFFRNIISASIHLASDDSCNGAYEPCYDVFYFELTGQAFLWHQVRCIMAVLILIGENNEQPHVIKDLLDVEKNPCKPQYSLANDLPLNLYNVEYHSRTKEDPERNGVSATTTMLDSRSTTPTRSVDDDTDDGTEEPDTHAWVYDEENIYKVITTLQNQWGNKIIKCTMMREMLRDLSEVYKTMNSTEIKKQTQFLLQGVRSKEYLKLMDRKRCSKLLLLIRSLV